MIGYVMVGTNNIQKATAFYDDIFTLIPGVKQVIAKDRLVVWADESGEPMFSVCTPYDGEQATVGNGVMVAFKMEDTMKVHEAHAKALSLGAADEGAPGPRDMLYCGYCRDLDGNKLNFYAFK